MATQLQDIEDIYRKEISLFQKLLGCVISEKDNLISLNIENLWALMEKKQKIIEDLDDTRGKIRHFREEADQGHDAPVDGGPVVSDLAKKIATLKEEIRVRAKENVSFVHETLGFFDEIISSFVRGGRSDDSYHPMNKRRKGKSTLTYHKEI